MCVYTIGIAEQCVSKGPDRIATLGLGSCVGLVLYDTQKPVGGMVHIMLPSAPSENVANKHKFADTAVDELIKKMISYGSNPRHLKAKLAGGAHMFSNAFNRDILNIGQRNVEMCHNMLQKHAIPIVGQDVGGASGRSIEFDCDTKMLKIRTISPLSTRLI